MFKSQWGRFHIRTAAQVICQKRGIPVLAALAFSSHYSPLTRILGIPIVNFSSQGDAADISIASNMALSIGSKAPDFSLSTKTSEGVKLIRLSDNFEKKNTLLLFFPMAFTGVCTAELCETSEGLDAYKDLNAEVYGISGDSPFSLEVWAEKEQIRVPLLSDYDHVVTKTYGVAYDRFAPDRNLPMGGVPKRSAFIIDRNGVIQYAEESDNPRQLPNFNAIKAKLNELA
jgi:peroxiredoxin